MQRFRAPLEIAESAREGREPAQARAQCRDFKALASFRMFRPPVPAALELHAGRPTRATFQGLRGEVLSASGPWRTSGDWWREDGWQQDEWDLEIDFHSSPSSRDVAAVAAASMPDRGLYRFYYDALRGGWFVRGIYD